MQNPVNFNPGIHEVLEFRDKLGNGMIGFKDIIMCNTFLYFWNNADSELVLFISENKSSSPYTNPKKNYYKAKAILMQDYYKNYNKHCKVLYTATTIYR